MNLDETLGIPLSPSVLPRHSTAKRLKVYISGAFTRQELGTRLLVPQLLSPTQSKTESFLTFGLNTSNLTDFIISIIKKVM